MPPRHYRCFLILTQPPSGTRFVLSRDELLTLPEFVLLSLFPNGLFPEGHMGGFAEGDAVQVDVCTSIMSTSTSTFIPPPSSLARHTSAMYSPIYIYT